GPRPEDGRGQVDRHPRRSDLWFALAAAGSGGSLCLRGFEGEVREGLRCGVDQGNGPRPLRSRLISPPTLPSPSNGGGKVGLTGSSPKPSPSPRERGDPARQGWVGEGLLGNRSIRF